MSKSRSDCKSRRKGQDKTNYGDGAVGYCRPPKATRFKTGHSGNPKGRPKGAKSEDTIFREVMSTRVPMSVRGKVRKVPVLEALWMKVADDALKGNAKSISLFLGRARSFDGTDPAHRELHQDDRQVLQSYFREVEAELIAKKEKP
jgi:hypothetical protein